MATANRKPADSLGALRGLRYRPWIRVSSKRQMARYGPPTQRASIEEFAAEYGVVLGGPEYLMTERGKTVWQSEQMLKLIEDVKEHKFDVLIVGLFDRWQRNARRTFEIVEDILHPNGVAWVMADRQLVSGNPKHWPQMRRDALKAEEYSEDLGAKVKGGFLAKRQGQHDMGGGLVGLGWKRDPDTHLVIPDPDQQPLVRRVFELAAQGWTDQPIADEVGQTLWRVRKVLRSPLFRGELPAGHDRPSGIRTNFDSPIDIATMSRALEHRLARTHTGNRERVNRVYPLSGGGPLICGVCERPVKGDAKTRRNGTKVRVYRHPEGTACTGWQVKEVPANHVEGQVGQLLANLALDPDRIRSAVATPVVSVDQLAVRRLDARLKQLGAELAASRGNRSDDEILAEIRLIRAEREHTMEAPIHQETIRPEAAVEYAMSLGSLWTDTDDEGRRALAIALFDKLVCVSGPGRTTHRIVKVALTRDALRHGLLGALPTSLSATENDEVVEWPLEVEGREERQGIRVLMSRPA